jgi:hypothetical protein
MELHLSAEERELLAEILEEHHRELLREIFRTDHHDFKQVLKHKEQVLEKLLDKVGIPVGA